MRHWFGFVLALALVVLGVMFAADCGDAGEVIDACPDDPNKDAPGQCGCGTPDVDEDGDGTADCVDFCTSVPDDQTDTDRDGFGDACDRCPANDPPSRAEIDAVCVEEGIECAYTPTIQSCGGPLDCGPDLEPIRTKLLANPPGEGDAALRREAIEALDAILIGPCYQAHGVEEYFTTTMETVAEELVDPVTSGAKIWMMYNHGFIVKTPEVVFGFDVVGFRNWRWPVNELAEQLDVLFITHRHGDHYDWWMVDRVLAGGGHVAVPAEDNLHGDLKMRPSDSLSVAGLSVVAHDALHGDTPTRMYEVTTPAGLRFLHTGDNQTSETLPRLDDIDVLLLNAWVNESGSTSAVEGMSLSIVKLQPRLTFPGHAQELGHDYVPGYPASRVPYAWPLEVMDDALHLAGDVHVLAWGERYRLNGSEGDVGAFEVQP